MCREVEELESGSTGFNEAQRNRETRRSLLKGTDEH